MRKIKISRADLCTLIATAYDFGLSAGRGDNSISAEDMVLSERSSAGRAMAGALAGVAARRSGDIRFAMRDELCSRAKIDRLTDKARSAAEIAEGYGDMPSPAAGGGD